MSADHICCVAGCNNEQLVLLNDCLERLLCSPHSIMFVASFVRTLYAKSSPGSKAGIEGMTAQQADAARATAWRYLHTLLPFAMQHSIKGYGKLPAAYLDHSFSSYSQACAPVCTCLSIDIMSRHSPIAQSTMYATVILATLLLYQLPACRLRAHHRV